MRGASLGSVEEAWEVLSSLRIRLRFLQKDVKALGAALHELSREAEARRPEIVVTRLNGDDGLAE